MSEIKLKDVAEIIEPLCPIKIIINGKVAWDDNVNDLEQYDSIFDFDATVKSFNVEIVEFHHSIVSINL